MESKDFTIETELKMKCKCVVNFLFKRLPAASFEAGYFGASLNQLGMGLR